MSDEQETEPVVFYFLEKGTRKIRVSREEWEQDWLRWWETTGSTARGQTLPDQKG